MKKIFLLLPALALLFSACDKKGEPNTRSISGEIPAVVTPLDPTKEVRIMNLPISVTQQLTDNVWNVKVTSFSLPGGGILSFTTPDMRATGSPNINLTYLSTFDAASGQTIRNFRTNLINYYYFLSMGGQGAQPGVAPMGTLINTTFAVGNDYSVATFPIDAYYGGKTITTYTDAEGEQVLENQMQMYHIRVNLTNMTAQVIICNPVFEPGLTPLATLTLSGLTLSPDRQYGYTIKGENIVPTLGAGQNVQTYPEYTFDSFEFHPTNSALTKGAITYSVAGKYKATFNGSYPVE